MKCPKCGSEDIEFTEAWDKNYDIDKKSKRIFIIVAVVLVIVTVGLFNVNFVAGIVGLVITVGCIGGWFRWYEDWKKAQKKKTHTKCICKNCENIWYLD